MSERMGYYDGQLPIPGIAMADARSVELIRVWIADKGLHCSLAIGAWEHTPNIDERKAWGIVLADAVKHIANALSREAKEQTENVSIIRASLLAELDRPTSSTAGDFVDGPSRN
jgi:Domain of unknown function (DUF5076)